MGKINILGKKDDSRQNYSKQDVLLFLRQKQIFNEIYIKRFRKIKKLNYQIDHNNLKYIQKTKAVKTDLSTFTAPITLLIE